MQLNTAKKSVFSQPKSLTRPLFTLESPNLAWTSTSTWSTVTHDMTSPASSFQHLLKFENSQNGSKCCLRRLGSNFSGAAFCLAQPVGGLLVYFVLVWMNNSFSVASCMLFSLWRTLRMSYWPVAAQLTLSANKHRILANRWVLMIETVRCLNCNTSCRFLCRCYTVILWFVIFAARRSNSF